MSKEVEVEKMKAIGARNLLKSYAKQREAQQEQLRALIVEKKSELDRLNTQYNALAKMESEQQEFIEQFMLQKWSNWWIWNQRAGKETIIMTTVN